MTELLADDDFASVTVQPADSSNPAYVSCSITVDGKLVDQSSGALLTSCSFDLG